MTELSRTLIGRGLVQSLGRSSLRTQGPQRERKALIAAAQTLASALQQRPFFTFEGRGYESKHVRKDDLLENSICDSPARKRER